MKKGWYWPLILVGLMVLVIGANLGFAWVATSDPSFAVEPDYYGKALAWDEHRAQDRQNERLGWTLELSLAPERSPDGTLALAVTLSDRDGRAIPGARVSLATFHNARASHVLETELREGAEGVYAVSLPMPRPGLWEFRFEAVRGDDRFTQTTVREVGWR
jgi:nitrogen fixation protein FixH